jgi:hypothetical protein
MDAHRYSASPSSQDFDASLQLLAAKIREAAECLLDLQAAIERLRLAREPGFAVKVHEATSDCLHRAMRR